MPMSKEFEQRLFPQLAQIVDHYGTPFHLYDWTGIRDHVLALNRLFSDVWEWRNYFAVKALPNPDVMGRLLQLGMGFDCSSKPELMLARQVGAVPSDIMFTSNNTKEDEFELALAEGGCILNLDDVSLIDKVPGPFPSRICFRYNPGHRRTTRSKIIGNPAESKYGVPHEQIVEAYTRAYERGARSFGIHTMLVSNELNYHFMVGTVRMLYGVAEMVSAKLGIHFEFTNIGGGFGTAYRPWQHQFNWRAFALEAAKLQEQFRQRNGYVPSLLTESGRAITGPHGVLVARCINRMHKYVELRGLDTCMSDLMRPGMYGHDTKDELKAYHRITVLNPDGVRKTADTEVVNVVGSLCEGIDVFALQRPLPRIDEGDLIVIHNTGAHGQAMGFNYNGRLRCQELLLHHTGDVELIRRAETHEDYTATLRFEPNVLKPAA